MSEKNKRSEDICGVIVYSFLVMDLPHWGHILHLQRAKKLGDILVVGILDNDTVESYKRLPIMSMEERMKVALSIKGVDLVIPQFEKFPLENLKILHELFPNDKIVCTHGSDWKKEDFTDVVAYLKSIGGWLRLLPYYTGTSTTEIIREITKRNRKEVSQ